ncbi:hypothetical protein [Secundilactobacillus oryzae]|uniref:hypothetical protein n=1 Tax=Secundilactobacillus oryzae TaxID=1202668 RepID=UPI0006D099DD|nr:hypothetical protein [Secundilactobacillus oryzae]
MMNKKFSALTMLYVANVLDGGRTVEECPAVLQADIQSILASAKKTKTAPNNLLQFSDYWRFYFGTAM